MQKVQEVVEDDLLLSREVMDIARISRRTLERWVADGKLPAFKVGGFGDRRYLRSDLTAILTPPSPSPVVSAPGDGALRRSP